MWCSARQAGIEPVVAVLGTALGEQHVQILKRLAERVVLVLDGDEAGQNRADEVLELFVRADVDLRVLTLPKARIRPTLWPSRDAKRSSNSSSRPPTHSTTNWRRLTEGVDFDNDTHAVTHAVDTMLKIVARAPDGLKTDQLLLRMSRRFDFKLERLEQRLEFLRGEESRTPQLEIDCRPSIASPRRPERRGVIAGASFDPNAALAESAEHDAD